MKPKHESRIDFRIRCPYCNHPDQVFLSPGIFSVGSRPLTLSYSSCEKCQRTYRIVIVARKRWFLYRLGTVLMRLAGKGVRHEGS